MKASADLPAAGKNAIKIAARAGAGTLKCFINRVYLTPRECARGRVFDSISVMTELKPEFFLVPGSFEEKFGGIGDADPLIPNYSRAA